MFLCKECHDESNCDSRWCKKSFELNMLSLGQCEKCGKSAPCVDCHGYNFSKKESDSKQ